MDNHTEFCRHLNGLVDIIRKSSKDEQERMEMLMLDVRTNGYCAQGYSDLVSAVRQFILTQPKEVSHDFIPSSYRQDR